MQLYFLLLFSLLLSLGILYLGIGLKVFLSKRPVLFLSKWFFAILSLVYGPFFFSSLFALEELSFSNLILPITLSVSIIIPLIRLKGYTIIGITNDSFDNALKSALKQLNIPFEESFTRISLITKGIELQASILSSRGMGSLQIKKHSKAGNEILKDIVQLMNDYFKSNPTILKTSSAILHFISSGVLVGIGIWGLIWLDQF